MVLVSILNLEKKYSRSQFLYQYQGKDANSVMGN
jgi:hypothetical protein